MKLINLSLIIILGLSTNLFSWHYRCNTGKTNLLFIDAHASSDNILKFDYKNIHLNLSGDDINIEKLDENIWIHASFLNNKYNKISLKLSRIKDDENIIEFSSKIILKNNITSKMINVTCIGQKVIY